MKKQIRKADKPRNPHVKFFRSFFSQPDLAAELMELFFGPQAKQIFDLAKLKVEKVLFDGKVTDLEVADLVVSLPLLSEPEKTVRVLVFVASEPSDAQKVFERVMDYHRRVEQNTFAESKNPPWRTTIGVFYHGREPVDWSFLHERLPGSLSNIGSEFQVELGKQC